MKNSENHQTEVCQQALSLLSACKGGAEVVYQENLCQAEKYFHINAQKFGLAVIDKKVIDEKLKLFSYIRDFFNDIKHSYEIPLPEEVLQVYLCITKYGSTAKYAIFRSAIISEGKKI